MQGVESYQAKQHLNILGPVWQFALNLYQPAEQTMANGGTLLKKGVWTGLADTQFTNIPIRQKKNDSFSILGVAYIASPGLVKNTRQGRKERQMGAKYCLFLGSENPLHGPLYVANQGLQDSHTGGGGCNWGFVQQSWY